MRKQLRGAARVATAGAAMVAVLGAASGCGDNVSNTGKAPRTTPDPAVIDIVSASNAGGEVDPEVTLIDDADALDRFVDQFGGSPLGPDLGTAFRAYDDPEMRFGLAVVSLGCDVPTSATVTEAEPEAGSDPEDVTYVVSATLKSSGKQCYVPITSVAVVEVPRPLER